MEFDGAVYHGPMMREGCLPEREKYQARPIEVLAESPTHEKGPRLLKKETRASGASTRPEILQIFQSNFPSPLR